LYDAVKHSREQTARPVFLQYSRFDVGRTNNVPQIEHAAVIGIARLPIGGTEHFNSATTHQSACREALIHGQDDGM
jgi:hypothetical protein